MGTSRTYGNIYVDGHGAAHVGDYYVTHIHYGQQRQDINEILLESLLFERWDARLRNVIPALDQTCEWMLSHPHFRAWLDPDQISQHGGFLWLKGKPGSGKSTVIKKVVEWAQRDKSDYSILSYFFNGRSPDKLEKSSLGLYRSLTYQLLSVFPDGMATFVQMFSGKTRWGKISEDWTVAELQNFWLRLVANHKLPLCFMFVDALDEGGEKDVRSMIDFIVDLVSKSRQKDSTIHVFLSSRYYPNITIDTCLSVLMEEQSGHQVDIELYVSKKLKGDVSQRVDELRQLVSTRSRGVFLWVVMVVPILNTWYDQGNSTSVRIKRLEKVPVNLHDVFEQILFGDTFESQDMQESIILFQWVLFSLRPLRLGELRTAIRTSMNVSVDGNILVEAEEDESTSTEMFGRRLIHLSRGLVELTMTSFQPVAQLIHETVRDFLLGQIRAIGTDQRPTSQHEFATHLNASTCHCAIAKACLSRLIAVALRPAKSRKQDTLAHYAARYWWQHVEAAGGDAGDEVLRLATELFVTPGCLYTWVQNYKVDMLWLDDENHYDANLDTDKVATPLYYAACIGYKRLFNVILDQDIDVNTKGGEYGNALQAASARGHEKVVQMLLAKEADVNAQGGEYGNAL